MRIAYKKSPDESGLFYLIILQTYNFKEKLKMS